MRIVYFQFMVANMVKYLYQFLTAFDVRPRSLASQPCGRANVDLMAICVYRQTKLKIFHSQDGPCLVTNIQIL